MTEYEALSAGGEKLSAQKLPRGARAQSLFNPNGAK